MKDKKLEELKEVLGNYDNETLSRLYSEVHGRRTMARKSYKDFGDPGPEIESKTEESVDYNERLIPGEFNLLPVHFLEEGAVVQKAVARIFSKRKGPWGTGFLVSPSLLMTNNHVIEEPDFTKSLIAQFNYQSDFNGNSMGTDEYEFDPVDIFYTNRELDFTLVRLRSRVPRIMPTGKVEYYREAARPVSIKPGDNWGYIRLRDDVQYEEKRHVNIIQHPAGREKEVALQENHITHIYKNVIRYTTDTEPGSSGSPVFNNQWDLISIHHAAGDSENGKWLNNEGIRIDRIIEDLRSHFGETDEGRAVLSELGI
jgi:endonuclease G